MRWAISLKTRALSLYNTLYHKAVHCSIFLQIHGEQSLLPSSGFKKHSRLVARDVVSLAECLVLFGGTQKDDCTVKML